MEDGAPTLRIDDAHSGGVTATGARLVVAGRGAGRAGQGGHAEAREALLGGAAGRVTAGADGYVAVWAVHANDAVAGATLAAKNAQRSAGYAATGDSEETGTKGDARTRTEPRGLGGEGAKGAPGDRARKVPGQPRRLIVSSWISPRTNSCSSRPRSSSRAAPARAVGARRRRRRRPNEKSRARWSRTRRGKGKGQDLACDRNDSTGPSREAAELVEAARRRARRQTARPPSWKAEARLFEGKLVCRVASREELLEESSTAVTTSSALAHSKSPRESASTPSPDNRNGRRRVVLPVRLAPSRRRPSRPPRGSPPVSASAFPPRFSGSFFRVPPEALKPSSFRDRVGRFSGEDAASPMLNDATPAEAAKRASDAARSNPQSGCSNGRTCAARVRARTRPADRRQSGAAGAAPPSSAGSCSPAPPLLGARLPGAHAKHEVSRGEQVDRPSPPTARRNVETPRNAVARPERRSRRRAPSPRLGRFGRRRERGRRDVRGERRRNTRPTISRRRGAGGAAVDAAAAARRCATTSHALRRAVGSRGVPATSCAAAACATAPSMSCVRNVAAGSVAASVASASAGASETPRRDC